MGHLSGGNQQKVVLGKALMTQPKVVLLDEPTRGVDVGAKAEIHALISALADDGCAVLLVSSDLPELMGMSDRILMMRDGTLASHFDSDRSDRRNASWPLPSAELCRDAHRSSWARRWLALVA